MKFSKGDIVVCVRGKRSVGIDRVIVEEGKVYTVLVSYLDPRDTGVERVKLVGHGVSLFASRFEHAANYEPNPILRKIKKMEERFNKRKVSCAA